MKKYGSKIGGKKGGSAKVQTGIVTKSPNSKGGGRKK